MRKLQTALFIILAVLCIGVSMYPFSMVALGQHFGLLNTKSPELLVDNIWKTAFYGHLLLGGLSLLVGWIQFSRKFRSRYLNWHRKIGMIYIVAVFISGLCAIYLSFHATGGMVSKTGFFFLGVVWLTTTFLALQAIKNGQIATHQKWMIFSYAACFAAVSLRLQLPILGALDFDFYSSYRIVAWSCWVPNLVVAFFIVKQLQPVTSTT